MGFSLHFFYLGVLVSEARQIKNWVAIIICHAWHKLSILSNYVAYTKLQKWPLREMKLEIGEKIKDLRLASELTQEELADRAGLTRGFISQLENEQSSIQIDSLADILAALGVSLSDFFSYQAETQVVFSPSERVALDSKGASVFELMVPGSTNNIMDPILIELNAGEKLEQQSSLPGEQFGFVLKGSVNLRLGSKSYDVKKGYCFYFESNRVHQISNITDRTAQLLWVASPPQM